jgi:adenylate kinase family enzyme
VLLGPDDPLPALPRRVLVNGGSGAGKTTLAIAVAERLGLPHTEIDALYHGPGWVPREEFLDDVRALATRERWITEWQYADARPILLERCDLLVWLDLARAVTTWRVVRRTWRRRFRSEVLWNGNREGPLWHIVHDHEHIVRWAWSSHPRAAERIETVLRERRDLPVVRLSTPAEVSRWLGRLSGPDGTPVRPR